MTATIKHELAKLNVEQRRAVETIDGAVLVVAGPGTGKTQLLSLRAANILMNRDVTAGNILCLTFTEAGAAAMTKRLSSLIGRDAYGVHISTFHSFATSLRDRYPSYFDRGALDHVISALQAKRLINTLLHELPVTDPLYQNQQDGIFGNLGDVQSLISTIKRAGLAPEKFRAIIEQNLRFFEFAERNTPLLEQINTPLSGSRDSKREFLDALREQTTEWTASLPSELTQRVTEVPGIYVPYATHFVYALAEHELYDEETGKTTGYQNLRSRFFKKDKGGRFVFGDREVCEKLRSALGVFEAYQARLKRDACYDFDDMISDAIEAIEHSPELKFALQNQYRYLMVDEFQDTNGAQMRILDLLTDNSRQPNILAVGDDDQAIMRFQGASVEFINQFEKHYDSVCRVVLKTNYRSTPSLVRLGQTIAQHIENRAPASATEKKLVAHQAEAEPATFSAKAYPNPDAQYYEVAK
ncbi:MAG: ATP-dependent helicase, partial [Coriobacteriales bacterium]|nr:ATP-dependent helicase [Coriobacteriales bacterium]